MTLWTFYLALLGTASIAAFRREANKTSSLKFDFFLSIITWVGLFGYVTNIQMLNSTFWKLAFVIILVWDILFTLFYPTDEEVPIWARSIGLIFLFPLYLGLYRYAFE
ncbi:hypothetical protein WAK64_18445 [Bacillus spongiae]|uniref:Uncharacterized protein n=1 Tax=Bacillus spongiae TaxID=2683610 RepID=A0ABU8HI09_9BACI